MEATEYLLQPIPNAKHATIYIKEDGRAEVQVVTKDDEDGFETATIPVPHESIGRMWCRHHNVRLDRIVS